MKKLLIIALATITLSGCSLFGGSQVTIEDIYQRWQETDSISYGVVVHKSGGVEPLPTEQADVFLYSKGNNRSRMEFTQGASNTVFIYNEPEDIRIMYFPASRTYIDLTSGPFAEIADQSQDVSSNLDELYEDLTENFTISGSEEYNGRMIVFLEGTSDGLEQRVWIDKDMLLPIRFQTFNVLGEVQDDVELTDISTDPLSDDLFEVPDGATEGGFETFLDQFMPQ